MHFLKKIIFLLLIIISFSCQTKLEKQGWQRIPIVSQVDTSTIKKEKELVVQKMFYEGSPFYRFYISEKDSIGKIICRELASGSFFNSDIAYYKLESDSICFVKLFKQGNVQAFIKLGFGSWSSLEVLYEPKNSGLEKQGPQGTVLDLRADSSAIKKGKELVVERIQFGGAYHYSFTFVEKDSTGKIIDQSVFIRKCSFKSDMADYKWESDSLCLIKLVNHGNVQASFKYIEHSDSSSSFAILNDLKQ